MDINHLAVWVSAVLSMVLGMVWFGPLFGKKWMEIIGATEMDVQRREEMQKQARPLYAISFGLAVLQVYLFAYLATLVPEVSTLSLSFIVWAGFVVPTVAAGSMWNNDSRSISQARFLINAGYYLILFAIYGYVLSF